LTEAEDYPPAVNVLSEEKKQQVLALGRLAFPSDLDHFHIFFASAVGNGLGQLIKDIYEQ
jgi:hypothetical protein